MTKAALLLALVPQLAPQPARVGGAGDPALPLLPQLSAGHPFVPDTVLSVPGGPRIVRLDMPGSPLVAMRLSIPLEEGGSEAGAGYLLQIMGADRARALAGPVGVQVEGTRTPWGVAYTIVGTRPDFDFLAYLLREAAAEPAAPEVEFERARLALRAQALGSQETAAGRVVAALRAGVAPSMPPLEGTVESLDGLTLSAVRGVWRRSHRAGGMTLVIAGDVPEELLLSAFQRLGSSGEAPRRPAAPAPRGQAGRAQVIRHWYGEARTVGDPRDPHPTVAALLISDRLRGAGSDWEAQVQLWEMEGRQVIAIVGAAYPGAAVRMRGGIRAALGETSRGVTAERVRSAVATVRHELLREARTPGGLVTVVGRLVEATTAPDGARSFLDSLESVTPESMVAFLGSLERQTPQRAEVRP